MVMASSMYVMRCATWYHLYNLKKLNKFNFSNVVGFSLQVNLLKVTFLKGCFLCFVNCTNGTKLGETYHIELQHFVKPLRELMYRKYWQHLKASLRPIKICDVIDL